MVRSKFQKDPDSNLSTAFQKFEALFDNFDSFPVADWAVTHALVYICKKYEEKFGMKFVLSYKGSPSTCPEYKLTARIFMMLGVKKGQGQIVKDFVDFFYKNYRGKTYFTSIGALAKNDIVAAFKKQKAQLNRKTRTTPLPERFVSIASSIPDVSFLKTWGDLAFLRQAMESEKNSNYEKLFEKLVSEGLDLKELDGIV